MKPGIYTDMHEATYYADPCPKPSLSQSIAKILLDQSPAHAFRKHPRLGGQTAEIEDYDKRKAIGNAAHKLVLGRGREVSVLGYPDFKTQAAREARMYAERAKSIVILEKHNAIAEELAEAVLGQTGEAFRDGQGEVVLIWEEDGTWFRTLIDYLKVKEGLIYDLKTSGQSCSPQAIPARILDDGWDVQAAMQERGLKWLGVCKKPKFRFVACEQDSPHALTVNELSGAVMDIGRRRLKQAIKIWQRCCVTGNWPAYPTHPLVHELPQWAERRWLDREIDDAAFKSWEMA